MTENIDIQIVDKIIEKIGTTEENVLAILQATQDHFGYLPAEALERICQITDITPANITGISTFYDQFRLKPCGEHIVKVCVGTACHVKGAEAVYQSFLRHLNIDKDSDTDAEGLFTIQRVACLGCCTLAPAVQIENITYGHVEDSTVGSVLEDFLERQKRKSKQKSKREKSPAPPQGQIRIGLGSCCVARGSGDLLQALEKAVDRLNINTQIKQVGCVGMCYQTPLLEIVTPDDKTTLYVRVNPQDAESILLKHFSVSPARKIAAKTSRMIDKLLTDSLGQNIEKYPANVREPVIASFLGNQKHITTQDCGTVSPVDIDEYITSGGFEGLKKALNTSPADVIDQIKQSGLRGRGGGGFPAAIKWQMVHQNPAKEKYVICNGDEGDPGAFMDRMLMESYPYRIIEGIAIAAYAVGAGQVFFYIRAEYPLALERISQAIEKCKQHNLIGDNILGTNFSFEAKIVAGAGAFVCGEETALLASIEGTRGTPHLRPPYPAEKGLWSKPTLINNVESLATVPWIIANGGSELAKLGTEKSKGTKVFALAGKVDRGGLIEVPMGITIRQIVEDIGGGTGTDTPFKAVQVGGPSGGCVPAEMSDIPVDFESLTAAGAIMGSGGLVVLDQNDCMVDIAKYFLEFTQDQSCGKCTFCRIGTKRMLEILDNLCTSKGKEGDIEKLQSLADSIKASSLCGLGKTAPNPVLSTIKYFRDEYQAHIDGSCPAHKCQALITYQVTDDCIGCTLCARACPADAIEFKPYEKHEIDTTKCIRCGGCKKICPVDAITVK